MARLGEIAPRERAGADTGKRYEYQYQQTARAALTMLDDEQKHVCEEVEPECNTDAECAVNSICDIGVCDAGKCSTVPAPSTVTCDDGDPCTGGDVCQQGQCADCERNGGAFHLMIASCYQSKIPRLNCWRSTSQAGCAPV